MKKYILLSLLVLSSSMAFSQAPGFQGKRFWVDYKFGFFPDILHGSSYTYANVNMQHHAELNWVVNMNRSIGFSYSYSSPTINLAHPYYYDNYYYNSGGLNEEAVSAKGRMMIHAFGFFTKLFKKPYIAPNGAYGKLGVDLIYYTSKVTEGSLDSTGSVPQTAPKGFDVALKLGFGRQYVVAKRMTIDFGFEAGLPFRSLFTYGSSGSSNTDFSEAEAKHRLFQQYIMQIHVALGFLAF